VQELDPDELVEFMHTEPGCLPPTVAHFKLAPSLLRLPRGWLASEYAHRALSSSRMVTPACAASFSAQTARN
jgi:hypothetical protein